MILHIIELTNYKIFWGVKSLFIFESALNIVFVHSLSPRIYYIDVIKNKGVDNNEESF
jgi:hypothetical protein